MSLVWDRRIAHIDRPVKPRNLRRFKKRLRKEEHRRRRGLPSRNIETRLFLVKTRLRSNVRLGKVLEDEAKALAAKFAFADLQSRLLERKRLKLQAVRAARRSVGRDGINLWRRRQLWLEQVELAQRAE
jgi:hypothetical protein